MQTSIDILADMALLIQMIGCHVSLAEKFPSGVFSSAPQCPFTRQHASPMSRLYRTLFEVLMDFLNFLCHCAFMAEWRQYQQQVFVDTVAERASHKPGWAQSYLHR